MTVISGQERDVHAKVFEAVQELKNRAVLDRVLRHLRDAVNLPDGTRQRAIARGFMELVPTYRPSPTGLGKHISEPVPAIESLLPVQMDSPKIVVLRPSIPLARLQS